MKDPLVGDPGTSDPEVLPLLALRLFCSVNLSMPVLSLSARRGVRRRLQQRIPLHRAA